MFRWHSTLVEPSRSAGEPTTASAAHAPCADGSSSTGTARIIVVAYRDMVDAGRDAARDPTGKLMSPNQLLRAVELAGVHLGPRGAGMLIALADRVPIRPPTKEEFESCCRTEGSIVGVRPPPAAAAARGRGLGHLCSVRAGSTTTSVGTGRGSAPGALGASRGARGAPSAACKSVNSLGQKQRTQPLQR